MKATIQWLTLSLLGLLLPGSADRVWAQGDVWRPGPDMPTARRLLAAAVEGGKLYTFGGCGSPCFQPPLHTSTFEETRVEVYDGTKWTVDPNPMPTILYGAAAVAPGNGRIYTLGGYLSGNVVQEYTPGPVTGAWSLKSPMLTARYGLAAVALQGKIYAIGGSGPSNALEMYDPATDTWMQKAPMPTARVFLSAAVVDGEIYAIGGSPDCCGDSQTNVVEIYDPATNSWRAGAPLPIAEQTSAAAAVNGKVYVLGGFIPGSGVQAATFEYDPGTNAWTAKALIPVPRDQASAAVLNGEIVVAGGSTNCHCMARGTNETYTPPAPTPMADLAINKDDHVLFYRPGDTLTYTITVQNPGLVRVDGAQVTDMPPSNSLTDVTWCRGQDCIPTTPGPLNDALGLAAGETSPYTLRAQVRPEAIGDIINDACVQFSGKTVCAPPDIDKPAHTGCIDGPVTITKTDGRDTVSPGDRVTYQITLQNGRCTTIRATVTDRLSSTGLTGFLWCRGGACTPSNSTDIEDTVSIPAKDSATYTVTATIPTLCGLTQIVNTACAAGILGQSEVCATDTDPVQPLPSPHIEITKSGPASVLPGAIVPYTVTVTNQGPCAARGVEIGEQPPPGFQLLSANAPCAAGFPCSLGALPARATTTFQALYKAPSGPCGSTFTNTATATSNNAPTVSASAATRIDCPCDVSITKTDGVTSVAPGDSVLYTLTVQNNSGQTCTATASDTSFPPGLGQIRWCRGAACTPSTASVLEDTLTLPPGGTEVYRVGGFVRVPSSCSDQLSNQATVSLAPGQIDPTPEDNTATDVDNVVPKSGVKGYCTAIDGPFIQGGIITYTFVLLNGGPINQNDNPGPEFTDTLPAGLTLLGASASSGSATIAANTMSWNGAIPACGSVTLTVTAQIGAMTKGTTICNQGTVLFDTDGNGVNESSGPTDDPSLPGPSDPCCFTVLTVIPTLSDLGLELLALLLAILAVGRLKGKAKVVTVTGVE